ncbi:hypothetical protein [Nonomuraea rubra]|uniref:Glycosyl hydrolase family 32 N-terminal domain-containing protein n=1 Tax=Nonomuraea rubra TaxID=46180 RepID=A0A7X0NXS2_9ACTN|nr:hypothetical protein [Nonomuraea rubra]MBB6551591.1 hypothetical protein [Nonomuraea rubra]
MRQRQRQPTQPPGHHAGLRRRAGVSGKIQQHSRPVVLVQAQSVVNPAAAVLPRHVSPVCQHNPHGLNRDTMHWGHATSPDLAHWTQRPIALEPGVHNATLWSGGGWADTRNVTGLKNGDHDPILLFTTINGVSIAYSTDGGHRFQMYGGGANQSWSHPM